MLEVYEGKTILIKIRCVFDFCFVLYCFALFVCCCCYCCWFFLM